jgi:flagellar biosynthesis/type III secretory pathway M-ring protein FliF/YscJ
VTVAYLLILIVLAGAVYLVSAPLRAARQPDDARRLDAEVDELEAEREAKYREIRDAELDLRTGKLSDADHAAIDTSLRTEAVAILHRLDEARGTRSERIPSRS